MTKNVSVRHCSERCPSAELTTEIRRSVRGKLGSRSSECSSYARERGTWILLDPDQVESIRVIWSVTWLRAQDTHVCSILDEARVVEGVRLLFWQSRFSLRSFVFLHTVIVIIHLLDRKFSIRSGEFEKVFLISWKNLIRRPFRDYFWVSSTAEVYAWRKLDKRSLSRTLNNFFCNGVHWLVSADLVDPVRKSQWRFYNPGSRVDMSRSFYDSHTQSHTRMTQQRSIRIYKNTYT